MEIMFPFRSKEEKDLILSNYEQSSTAKDMQEYKCTEDIEEEEEVEKVSGWGEGEEVKLEEYFDIFKDNMATWVGKLAMILNKDEKEIEERLRQKGLLEAGDNSEKRTKEDESVRILKMSKLAIKRFIIENLEKNVPHQKIIDDLSHLEKTLDISIPQESNSVSKPTSTSSPYKKHASNSFRKLSISPISKSRIYSSTEATRLMESLGMAEELGEYFIPPGAMERMGKVRKWLSKGRKKVEQMVLKEQQ
jgi:hypothetical protein